ncbi:FMN-binding negative transcriptional regulator [Humidisolicoccus flavus]|uniref:FMN-binding negative transcriptional regulator n=1 Tax=Humidisolicoccus flavus TaxID=3111414 RepID=UPI00324EF3AB
MQPARLYARDSFLFARELVTAHPWSTLVSVRDGEQIASHTPLLVEAASEQSLVLVTHLGLADARLHGFHEEGPHSTLAVVQGVHGYISPSWYLGRDAGTVPTWNFEAAHLTCSVTALSAEENLEVLRGLVAHFEAPLEDGVELDTSEATTIGLARGTLGLRLHVQRVTGKAKFSQNKSEETRANVIAQLRGDGPYGDPLLAERMTLESDGRAAASASGDLVR